MKIVVLDGHALNPGDMSWALLEQFGELTVFDRSSDRQTVIARIADAEIITTNKVPIDATVMDACPNLKLICCLSTGYNVVDTMAARARKITVCNVPAYSTAAVAQFTFGLLLELCHRIGHHDHAVHQGRWSAHPDFCFWDTPQMELAGKTMGIIGFGRIGMAVAAIARAFGMNVLAYSRTERPEGSALGQYVDLDTLLAKSDVISLHCPLFPETEHLINADAIEKMKNGAILLNTSRGPVIDETAVADGLRCGKLKGAAVDVVSVEPMEPDNPLLHAPNCIITPHMAWAPLETRGRILEITAKNIRGFLDDKPINVVN